MSHETFQAIDLFTLSFLSIASLRFPQSKVLMMQQCFGLFAVELDYRCSCIELKP